MNHPPFDCVQGVVSYVEPTTSLRAYHRVLCAVISIGTQLTGRELVEL